MANINIHPLTVSALFVDRSFEGKSAGSATAFTVESRGYLHLVTNRHVIDDLKNPVDTLGVWFHERGRLGSWKRHDFRVLDDDGQALWVGHPALADADVAVMRIAIPEELVSYPVDLGLARTDLLLDPSEPVSVIGFPRGLSAGGKFPIWKTAHLASDIDLPALEQPGFLVDGRTKEGMSGSPVFALRIGMHRSRGGSINMGGAATRFLGIYSARLVETDEPRDRHDIGFVWKVSVLEEVLGAYPNP